MTPEQIALVADARNCSAKPDTMLQLWRSKLTRCADLIEDQAAELATLRAERDALPEQLIDILHVLDVEAQTIANRISGMHGVPCRHPDGVQVLEDAETIIRAALAALTAWRDAQ